MTRLTELTRAMVLRLDGGNLQSQSTLANFSCFAFLCRAGDNMVNMNRVIPASKGDRDFDTSRFKPRVAYVLAEY